ncbi:hypothetical protein BDZ91DRAFT_516818 [Kalaharituber pfeilii]|nr:hypothetical protein BDZ91DRAFT_516818 [Kalaharituber pfeilii]
MGFSAGPAEVKGVKMKMDMASKVMSYYGGAGKYDLETAKSSAIKREYPKLRPRDSYEDLDAPTERRRSPLRHFSPRIRELDSVVVPGLSERRRSRSPPRRSRTPSIWEVEIERNYEERNSKRSRGKMDSYRPGRDGKSRSRSPERERTDAIAKRTGRSTLSYEESSKRSRDFTDWTTTTSKHMEKERERDRERDRDRDRERSKDREPVHEKQKEKSEVEIKREIEWEKAKKQLEERDNAKGKARESQGEFDDKINGEVDWEQEMENWAREKSERDRAKEKTERSRVRERSPPAPVATPAYGSKDGLEKWGDFGKFTKRRKIS